MTGARGAVVETGSSSIANPIDAAFARLMNPGSGPGPDERDGRAALILYLTAGHPDPEASLRLAQAVARLADIVEIGIPFSDPVADGPVIQASSQTALAHGTTIANCMQVCRSIRAVCDTPIVYLTYYNPVLRFGLERFASECREAGAAGVICADLPHEESAPLHAALSVQQIHLIPLLAPTSTDERLAGACSDAGGFVYCLSRTGVTGQREALEQDLPRFLERIRRHTDLPRAVGFGISTPEQVGRVARMAEGVIVGSALVALIDRTPARKLESEVSEFVRQLRGGLSTHG